MKKAKTEKKNTDMREERSYQQRTLTNNKKEKEYVNPNNKQ